MLAQHQETGHIADFLDGQPLPKGYANIPEARRVPGIATRCYICGSLPGRPTSSKAFCSRCGNQP